MKLLIIPSWYPTKLHPVSGSFFRDRAHILKNNGIDIIIAAPIIHSLKSLKFINYLENYLKIKGLKKGTLYKERIS